MKAVIKKILSKLRGEEDEKPVDTLKRLARKAAPSPNHREPMSETLYWLDKIKNGMTVKTGEYEALTRIFTGQKMYVDTRDVSESPHLMMEGIREENVTTAFRNLWHSDFVFFDVGANYGYFPLLAGTDLDKNGIQLHLFEPNPDLIPLLEKTMSVNGLTSKSKLNQLAIGDKSGTITLHRLKNLWGGSTVLELDELKKYRPVEDEFDKEFKVKMTTIDNYVKSENIKKVDLVKIDVEGFEEAVYRGMEKTISNNKSLIVLLEFTFGAYENPEKFFTSIKSDFRYVYGVLGNGAIQLLHDYSEAQEAAQSEWLMIVASNELL